MKTVVVGVLIFFDYCLQRLILEQRIQFSGMCRPQTVFAVLVVQQGYHLECCRL